MLLTQQDHKGSVFMKSVMKIYLILHFITILIILVWVNTDLKKKTNTKTHSTSSPTVAKLTVYKILWKQSGLWVHTSKKKPILKIKIIIL